MTQIRAKTLVLAALLLGITSVSAEAANCQGRRDTGTAVGAIGGGLIGNAASNGDLGGTVVGALAGGLAGNVIGGANCDDRARHVRRAPARHYDRHGRAYYYDRRGHRHYYR
jgi:uncharacterized protein YcfJ